MSEKHLLEGQIVSYEKPGKGKVTVDIMSDFYNIYKRNAHIYTLKVVAGGGYDKGFMFTESGRVLYETAKVLIDVPYAKKVALINDKKVRKMIATKFKKVPIEHRVKRPQ